MGPETRRRVLFAISQEFHVSGVSGFPAGWSEYPGSRVSAHPFIEYVNV